MSEVRTLQETLAALTSRPITPSTPPVYTGKDSTGLVLAVASMKDHMTDEGWQIQKGLFESGYGMAGYQTPIPLTDVRKILDRTNPGIVFLQDKREWDFRVASPAFRDKKAFFSNVSILQNRQDIFKVTVVKDSHQKPDYHKHSADEIGCHAWAVYYHPEIVRHLAPYLRPQHIIRTYHSLDPDAVPKFESNRSGTFFSGAISRVYPLRHRIKAALPQFSTVTYHPHPGYHRKGTQTPEFLKLLRKFKVAICTSSSYGYALRKIIEAAACGCKVITDLPVEDVLPEIDSDLIRIRPDISMERLREIIVGEEESYDEEKQEEIAKRAVAFYDYKQVTSRLASDIESMRLSYGQQKRGM